MKIGICAGNLSDLELPKDLPFIGADRGVEKLLSQGITPAFAIGDFDSLKDKAALKAIKEIEILPARKDVTDTHAALEWAIEKGYDEILIYGATGGRLDHFMAALILLELHKEVRISIIDAQNQIRLLSPGVHKIHPEGYKYFSLFALDKARISISGAEYDLSDFTLLRNNPLATSNQVKGESARVETDADLLLIQSKDAPEKVSSNIQQK